MDFSVLTQPLPGLTAEAVLELVRSVFGARFPGAEWNEHAVKDEGPVLDRLRDALGGQYVLATMHGQTGRPTQGSYLSVKETAYIDCGLICGQHGQEPGFDATNTSSIGVGQLAAAALMAGHRRVVLILGDTAVNDFGLGAAAGLGARFTTHEGRPFIPVGRTVGLMGNVVLNPVLFQKGGPKIVVWCDTDAPLTGANGALERWRATDLAVAGSDEVLEEGIRYMTRVLKQMGHKNMREPYLGAGFGMGAGLKAFANADLKNGAQQLERVLERGAEEAELPEADTGFVVVPAAHHPDARAELEAALAKAPSRRTIMITGSGLAESAWAYEAGVDFIISDVDGADALKAQLDNLGHLVQSFDKN